jgi:hypothetical protein
MHMVLTDKAILMFTTRNSARGLFATLAQRLGSTSLGFWVLLRANLLSQYLQELGLTRVFGTGRASIELRA